MKKGFTLAEVLIALAIIGIVAAVTLPTLIYNYKSRVVVTGLKKYYALLSQAINMEYAENGSPENWGLGSEDQKNMLTLIQKRIGGELRYTSSGGPFLQLQNVRITYFTFSLNCDNWLPSHNGCGDLSVSGLWDNNAPFTFWLTREGQLIPYGTGRYDWYWDSFDAYKAGRRGLAWTTAWVLEYENLDFLKCPEKLSWNGKHKCSE